MHSFELNEQAVTLLMENGPGNMDVKAFIMQKENDYPPRIIVAYEIVNADGEEVDAGIEEPEEGQSMLPDKVELAEGMTPALLAWNFLQNHHASNASASFFHPGVWYETFGAHDSHRANHYYRQSFHLKGFTPEEEAEIYNHVVRKKT